MDLYNELMYKIKQLEFSIKELRNSGTKYAEAERDYKILLRQECLKLRDEGIAIGMIDKTCYGIPAVAEKRFKRDVAETMRNTNLEHIQVTKLKLRLLEAQLEREWSSSGKGDL